MNEDEPKPRKDSKNEDALAPRSFRKVNYGALDHRMYSIMNAAYNYLDPKDPVQKAIMDRISALGAEYETSKQDAHKRRN